MPIIALLTDFGDRDIYVGAMKAVILSICPKCYIVDLAHQIAPQDITAGALALWGAYRYFPKGTIFCAIVDPTVGSERLPVAVATNDYFFVGPNNGLLWWAISESFITSVVQLNNPAYFLPEISSTFHGRDIFAPVSAHIANGTLIENLGPPLELSQLKQLPPLMAKVTDQTIIAQIIYIDRFGNATTNLRKKDFTAWLKNLGSRKWSASIHGTVFETLCKSYADVPSNKPLLLFNSYDLLEIAINRGNASQTLNIRNGDELEILAVN